MPDQSPSHDVLPCDCCGADMSARLDQLIHVSGTLNGIECNHIHLCPQCAVGLNLPRIAVSRGKCVPISCLAQSIAESLKNVRQLAIYGVPLEPALMFELDYKYPPFPPSFLPVELPPSVIPSEEIKAGSMAEPELLMSSPTELGEEIVKQLDAGLLVISMDIGSDVSVSAGTHEMADANGWHDIPELQMASQRPAVEWPTEDDHDPTLVMGGIYDPAKGNAA